MASNIEKDLQKHEIFVRMWGRIVNEEHSFLR
jgi:hypothetical protein